MEKPIDTFPNRMAKSRAKKRKNTEEWESYLEKERERDAKRRKIATELKNKDASFKIEQQKKERLRKRKQREKKKLEKLNSNNSSLDSPIGTYSCRQSFGKAYKRAVKSLPKSPHKRKAVVRQLIVNTEGPEVVKKLYPDVKKEESKKKTSEELKNRVINFYNCDDISVQAPGKRDVITFKENGVRVKKQIRRMVMSVGEAYKEFKTKNPGAAIGNSKFYELRPKNVKLVSETPQSVCVCKYHENFLCLSRAISKSLPNFPGNHNIILNELCCSTSSERCMMSQCKYCKEESLFSILPLNTDLQKDITWFQWQSDEKKQQVKVKNKSSLSSAVNELSLQVKKFKAHSYVKNVQSDYFSLKKSEVTNNKAVMQVDFAENFTLSYQDEIQSAHWAHNQVALLTCVIWMKNKTESYVVVSDDLSHSKYSVWVFIKRILSDVELTYPQVQHIDIFSDNCAAQFKNRYTLSSVCTAEDEFNVSVTWNFFASGHGKGAVDAIGGICKRIMWTAIMSRAVHITCARDFAEELTDRTSVNVIYVSKECVDATQIFLDEKWKNQKALTDLRSHHSFEKLDSDHILASKTAYSLPIICPLKDDGEPHHKTSDNNTRHSRLRYTDVYTTSEDESEAEDAIPEHNRWENMQVEINSVDVGSYLSVRLKNEKGTLQSEKYVGICQERCVIEREVKVLFMKKYGGKSSCFIINDNDEAWIAEEQIVAVLKDPTLKRVGNTVLYSFDNHL